MTELLPLADTLGPLDSLADGDILPKDALTEGELLEETLFDTV